MTTVKQLLAEKGHTVWTIDPDKTVLDAIRLLAEKDVGALVVVDGDRPIGMFSERDYVRKVYLKGKTSPTTLVREVMSTPLVSVGYDHTTEQCMAIMTNRRIRHLPVIEDGRLVGIVSIGDLVNSIIREQHQIIEQLENYIHS
ncbi:MAG: CBS domain-containing protein [Geminicoccaceae bacterium]|nr:CBS domain-containing protein [Geminicoccaceae bacterium]MCS7266707.1 CBS domain-containing protein [Geminicoccaceae bacterium]MCX7630768.1 CBS domain-containing protein [Geminicoccaceae bacterium]MDW8124405.1 CBS domain-containing protein [Geminicoccaceae bacterium]MDW8340823.1 CBS domain-containing protein [Geminicoccaceae bacterium]